MEREHCIVSYFITSSQGKEDIEFLTICSDNIKHLPVMTGIHTELNKLANDKLFAEVHVH